MAKELMGAVVTKGKIEATHRRDMMGAVQTLTKRDKWPDAVLAAAAALIKVCDDLTAELDDVVQVQVYTPITDPDGTAFAAPGECIDVTFRGEPGATRIGDLGAVPSQVASARDALKAAVLAAL